MEKNKDSKPDNKKGNKKPLKLSSSGRLQIRKNLGPTGNKAGRPGSKKTIQIVFRNKNNQQKQTSAAQSNFRGSSSFRTPGVNPKASPPSNFFNQPNKNFSAKNKKNAETKKSLPKKSTLKPQDDEFAKLPDILSPK